MTFFSHVNRNNLLKIIQNIDPKKSTQQSNILVRIIKENKFTFPKIFPEMFNFYHETII